MDAATGALEINLDAVPPHERVAFFRDGLRDVIGRYEIDPLGDQPMRQRFLLHPVMPINLMTLNTSAVRAQRAGDQHGEEELSVNFMTGGSLLWHKQAGREIEIRPGAGLLVSLYEPYECISEQSYAFEVVRLSRRELATRFADVEAALAAPAVNPSALSLMFHYLEMLRSKGLGGEGGARLAFEVSAHIHDLAALAFAPAEVDRGQAAFSVAAARLAAIKDYLASHLTNPALSAEGVARRFGITDRYLRKLFESEGGFWHFVTRERLKVAIGMLENPAMRDVKIIDIAHRSGFGSVSSFNRMFRDAYGMAPLSARP